jgi:hypothetical protein
MLIKPGIRKPAAATTQQRKRAVFYNALAYAVEVGLLSANPVDRIQWKARGRRDLRPPRCEGMLRRAAAATRSADIAGGDGAALGVSR